jgi:hypothetical protein
MDGQSVISAKADADHSADTSRSNGAGAIAERS